MIIDPQLLCVGSHYLYRNKRLVKLLGFNKNGGTCNVEYSIATDRDKYGAVPFAVLPSQLHYAAVIRRSKDGGI